MSSNKRKGFDVGDLVYLYDKRRQQYAHVGYCVSFFQTYTTHVNGKETTKVTNDYYRLHWISFVHSNIHRRPSTVLTLYDICALEIQDQYIVKRCR